MSLDPAGSVQIKRTDLYPTPLWYTNLPTNNVKERKVSLNEDILNFLTRFHLLLQKV